MFLLKSQEDILAFRLKLQHMDDSHFFSLHPVSAAPEGGKVRRSVLPSDRLHFTIHGLLSPGRCGIDLQPV